MLYSEVMPTSILYLVQSVQHFVGHMVLYHHWRYQHFVEIRILSPKGLINWFVGRQGLSGKFPIENAVHQVNL